MPPALVITAKNYPLQDEGEAYAGKLMNAGVPATTRDEGTIHDFVLLSAIRDLAAGRAALRQARDGIRAVLKASDGVRAALKECPCTKGWQQCTCRPNTTLGY